MLLIFSKNKQSPILFLIFLRFQKIKIFLLWFSNEHFFNPRHLSANLSSEHGGSLRIGGICTNGRRLKKRIEIGIHPGKIEIYNPGSFPDDLTPIDFISRNLPSYKRNKLILDILFRSKDVEKSGTGFQRVNDFCKQQNVTWNYRKEAYEFFFEFIRTNVRKNVQINTELTEAEQVIFNLIQNNEGISKAEMAIRIGKSEKTVQRLISSLTKKQVIEREGSNKSGSWKIKI